MDVVWIAAKLIPRTRREICSMVRWGPFASSNSHVMRSFWCILFSRLAAYINSEDRNVYRGILSIWPREFFFREALLNYWTDMLDDTLDASRDFCQVSSDNSVVIVWFNILPH